jgi:hypothetical protein
MAKSKLKRLSKLIVAILFIVALLIYIAVIVVVPRVAQSKIRSAIEAQGYGPVRLLRPDIGLYRTTLANLSIGNPDRPQIELASATVTYTPSQLLAGQVDDILLSGLLMRIEPASHPSTESSTILGVSRVASATQPASFVSPESPATSPAAAHSSNPFFRTARLTNARAEFVDPETGLPTSMLIDAQAKAGSNRKIDFSISTAFGAAKAVVTGTADPGFEVIDADIAVRGVTLDALRPLIPGGIPAKLTEPAEIDAQIHVDRVNGPRYDLPNIAIRVPSASLDIGAQNRIDVHQMVFSMAGSVHKYGSDWYAALTRGPNLTIDSINPPAPFQPVPLTISFAPTYARIGTDSWGISCEGAALDIDKSRFGLDLRPFTVATSPNGLVGSISARLREIDLVRNPVVEKIVPEIKQWNVTGKLVAGMSLQLEGGTIRPRLNVRLDNCNLQNTDYELKVQGINAAFAVTGLSPLRSETDQTISAKYVQMGKWEIVDAEAKFAIPGEMRPTILLSGLPGEGEIIKVDVARFGWAGGDVWCSPFVVNLAQPRIRTELAAKDLDLSKILWVVSGSKAWAEGIVDMKLWADYSWPEIRFGNGWASSRPDWRISVTDPTKGQTVMLHLPDSAQQLDNWFRLRDPRFQDNAVLAPIREQVVGTVADFHVDEFRADFARNPDGKQLTTIRLHGGGRETNAQTKQSVDTHKLDLSITATDLDILVSHFLKVKSEGADQAAITAVPATQAAATQGATTQPATGKAGSQ